MQQLPFLFPAPVMGKASAALSTQPHGSCSFINRHVSSFLPKLLGSDIMSLLRHYGAVTAPTFSTFKIHTSSRRTGNKSKRAEQFRGQPSSSVTYSLLIRDVQFWFGVRLQLVLLESRIDPPILHDLLKRKQNHNLSLIHTILKKSAFFFFLILFFLHTGKRR